MRVIGSTWEQCIKPRGCGWYWQVRTVQDHWWSRPRKEYRGAFWENEDGRPELSMRPEEHQRRWIRSEQFQDEYSDCLRYLTEVDRESAIKNSAMARA